MPGAGGLPTGTVTFLFTDLEGSTRLWEQHPEEMKTALARHDEILRDAVESHGGHVVKTTGDGLHAAFGVAGDAVETAIAAQEALADLVGPEGSLRVRMGLHTGAADVRDGDYFGSAVNRAARVSTAANGGQILMSQATQELVRDSLGEGRGLLDLGEHRLRDLARSERLFQLNAPGLAHDFPPIRSVDAFPGNLPSQLTSFVGRDREIAAISKALDQNHLVTLTGVGGVGKTRLATQLAAEVLPRYPDGAWLCELAAADDDDALEQVIAATLGVRPRPGLGLDESIAEFLRVKQALLVLDNCEHLLDAAGRLAELILRDCPGVRIVATSREGLAVEGEHVMPLRSLALPPKDAERTEVETDAMRLFADRAAAVKGEFTLDANNARAVAEICRRLDGMPLAIELAAARIVAMSPNDIATRLDERFRLLTGGRRTAVERHQTLRATVDWSYSMLEDRERQVFDRLGVFVGGFDAAAAEAVVTGDGVETWDVVDALVDLVAKSMVVADETDDGGTRYQLLETLRHYARERLDEHDDADEWRRRHAEHFAAVAEEVGQRLTGPDELAARRAIYANLDNFRAAVLWGLDRDDDAAADLAVRIATTLAVEASNNRATGIGAWGERALIHADRSQPGPRATLYGVAAMQVFYRGELDRAAELATAALASGLPADCVTPTYPYIVLANIEANRGRNDAAREVVEQGIAALQANRVDAFHQSVLVACEAIWDCMAGELDRAHQRMADVLADVRRSRNPTALAVSLYAYGWSCWQTEPEDALANLDESVALTRAGATESCLGPALMETARLRWVRGDRSRALADLRDAVVHCHTVADYTELAGVLITSCSIFVSAGDSRAAAVIAGFVSDGLVAPFAPVIQGPEGAEYASALDRARADVGGDFDAAFRDGAAMSYEEVVQQALHTIDGALADV